MPNHVHNTVMITGPKEDVKALIEMVVGVESAFSFDRVIHMPACLRDVCTGGCTIDGKSASRWYESEVDGKRVRVAVSEQDVEMMTKVYGAADWHEWATHNWGTKWDAYDVTWQPPTASRPGRVRYEFLTAWDSPIPLIQELSRRFPALAFRVECDGEVDEPFGYTVSNSGETTMREGGAHGRRKNQAGRAA